MDYSEKLKDPRWQRKRLEILERDEWTCQKCKDKTITLHVHHKTYSNGEPWDTDNNLLVTLCEDCHSQEQIEKREYEKLFLKTFYSNGFYADDLRELAYLISELPCKIRIKELIITKKNWMKSYGKTGTK